MKTSRMLVAAVSLLVASGMIGNAGAEDQASQQETHMGAMMGNRMMGPYGMMGYGAMGPGMMGWGGSGQAMCTMMGGHIDGRLAYLKAELKITGAQEPLWKAYAEAARDSANAMLAHCSAMMSARHALSLPERLDQHEQMMTAHLEAVRATNKALKPLYAAFSDGQKQTADQLFWGPMGMGMM